MLKDAVLSRFSQKLGMLAVCYLFTATPAMAQPDLFDLQLETTDPPDLFDLVQPTPSPPSLPAPNLLAPSTEGPSFDIRTARGGGLYRVGPGDQLNIQVFGIPEFSGIQRVLIDGTVTLPLLETISVQGLTLGQLSQLFSELYDPFLKNPVVTVTLEESLRPLAVSVLGEVNRPGVYEFRVNQGEVPSVPNLMQLANGLTQQADVRNVEIRRPQPTGEDQILKINLWDLFNDGEQAAVPILLDGDTLFVSTATNISLTEISELASASFSPAEMVINVVGEVQAPGTLRLPPNTPLNQALLAAGGFTQEAKQREVELLRLNSNGTVSLQQVPIDFASSINSESNPPLQNFDVVVVDNSRLSKVSNRITSITRPLLPIATLLSIFRDIRDVSVDLSGGDDD